MTANRKFARELRWHLQPPTMTAVHALAHHALTAGANHSTECEPPRATGAAPPLSEALWNLRWPEHLPFDLGAGSSVRASSFDRAAPFIRAHYATIFEQDPASPFQPDALTPAKSRYYQHCADFFEFTREDQVIGLLVCDPLDWSTYYVRSAAILPEHQGRQLVQRFFTAVLFDTLAAAGVERVEIDVSPTNLMMLHAATRYRFIATGTVLTERWGAHTRFTKFLNTEKQRVFTRQFCTGVKYHQPA
jgi:hypothetical protein